MKKTSTLKRNAWQDSVLEGHSYVWEIFSIFHHRNGSMEPISLCCFLIIISSYELNNHILCSLLFPRFFQMQDYKNLTLQYVDMPYHLIAMWTWLLCLIIFMHQNVSSTDWKSNAQKVINIFPYGITSENLSNLTLCMRWQTACNCSNSYYQNIFVYVFVYLFVCLLNLVPCTSYGHWLPQVGLH